MACFITLSRFFCQHISDFSIQCIHLHEANWEIECDYQKRWLDKIWQCVQKRQTTNKHSLEENKVLFLLIEGRLEHDPRKLKAISDKNYFLSSNLENITIPKIMLQSPSMNLKKHFYPYNISPDLVSRTLSCPLKENTFILHQEDSDADNDDCHPGKYLFSNGKIQQRFCFTTSCTRCQKTIYINF